MRGGFPILSRAKSKLIADWPTLIPRVACLPLCDRQLPFQLHYSVVQVEYEENQRENEDSDDGQRADRVRFF